MTETAQERDAVSAVTELAAMLIKAALTMPIGTMKAACDLQMRMLEMMEGLIPGLDASAAAGAPGAPATTPASSPGGWRPVTLQVQVPVTPPDPSTGWGPMPGS